MFNVDDYVVYGSEGVCRVESIGHPQVSGLDKQKEYYTLLPNSRSGRIYTPTDSPILMRYVISKERALELIDGIGSMNPELEFNVPRDAKLAMNYYRGLVRTYECETLIKVIKYVRNLQKRLTAVKRNVPAVDLKYLRIAEDMLYSEFSFVLDVSITDIRSRVISLCEDDACSLNATL